MALVMKTNSVKHVFIVKGRKDTSLRIQLLPASLAPSNLIAHAKVQTNA